MVGEVIPNGALSGLYDDKTGRDALPGRESLSFEPGVPDRPKSALRCWDAVFCRIHDMESCSYSFRSLLMSQLRIHHLEIRIQAETDPRASDPLVPLVMALGSDSPFSPVITPESVFEDTSTIEFFQDNIYTR